MAIHDEDTLPDFEEEAAFHGPAAAAAAAANGATTTEGATGTTPGGMPFVHAPAAVHETIPGNGLLGSTITDHTTGGGLDETNGGGGDGNQESLLRLQLELEMKKEETKKLELELTLAKASQEKTSKKDANEDDDGEDGLDPGWAREIRDLKLPDLKDKTEWNSYLSAVLTASEVAFLDVKLRKDIEEGVTQDWRFTKSQAAFARKLGRKLKNSLHHDVRPGRTAWTPNGLKACLKFCGNCGRTVLEARWPDAWIIS